MKHSGIISFFALTLAALLAVTGCATTTELYENNVINSKNIEINQNFDREDYLILGKITVTSDYVAMDRHKKIIGDSKKYGFINQNKALIVNEKSKKNKKINYALETARQNATYELIEKASEMGADTILEPLEQVETKVETTNHKDTVYYKVTMTALAVQLKRDIKTEVKAEKK